MTTSSSEPATVFAAPDGCAISLYGRGPSPRSGRQHKAWGASPRDVKRIKFGARETGDSRTFKHCRPLRGLAIEFYWDPGACAPGFMLTPASQAKRTRWEVVQLSKSGNFFSLINVDWKGGSVALSVGLLWDHRFAHRSQGTHRTPRTVQNIACPGASQSRLYEPSLNSCCRSLGKQ